MSDNPWAPGAHVGEWDEGPLDALFHLLEPPAWHAQAKCKGLPTKLFYPARGEVRMSSDSYLREEYPARKYCNACPVRAECLEAGLQEVYGIWGGTSGRQRRRMRLRRRLS